jgi:YegS/Rv2252/BmrU family lipid kinase
MAIVNTWLIILNPTSGNGSGKRKWPVIKELLELNKFDFDYFFTEYSKHGCLLIQNAIKKGYRKVICIGGDGTLHNIINGIMNQNIVPSNLMTVGVIPIGTGNDWVKTHGISKDIKNAILTIKKGKAKTQDIGKITLWEHSGKPIYFMNLSGIGFDGYVVSKVEKYKKFGSMAYLVGAFFGLLSFKNFNSIVTVNSERVSGRTLMVLIGLCRFSGGGMQLTKTADPFDGLFDVSIAKNFTKFDIIKNLMNLFNGKIVNHKKVETFKSTSIKIEMEKQDIPYIQADGELIGRGSFSISIIPKSFAFYSD